MIPVMDWTAGGTLGSESGEYEGGRGGGVGVKRSVQMELWGGELAQCKHARVFSVSSGGQRAGQSH